VINTRKRNFLAGGIKQTHCNRNELGFLDWLSWSWRYLLTAKMSPSNILKTTTNKSKASIPSNHPIKNEKPKVDVFFVYLIFKEKVYASEL